MPAFSSWGSNSIVDHPLIQALVIKSFLPSNSLRVGCACEIFVPDLGRLLHVSCQHWSVVFFLTVVIALLVLIPQYHGDRQQGGLDVFLVGILIYDQAMGYSVPPSPNPDKGGVPLITVYPALMCEAPCQARYRVT